MPPKVGNSKLSFYAIIILIVVFALVKIIQVRSTENYIQQSNAIAYDVYGYYLHLPATVIHHDPGIENRSWLDSLNTKYQQDRPWYQAWPGEKGRLTNVYPIGIAVIWSPFFLVAHVIAGVAGYPQDGLSAPYQFMILFAGWFYAVLGLLLLRRLLLKFVSDKITAITLLLIGVGTNFYHYATYDSTMPHVLIFPFILMIVLLTISWHESPTKRKAFLLGLLLALVTISRPPEIIWIFIPILWGVDSFRALKEKILFFFSHFTHLVFFMIGAILLGSMQLLYWKYTSGHFLSNNHVEGFDFFRPFTMEFLFSYKKGWLLYTPLMIFAIIGFVALFRKNRKLFYPIFVSFLLYLWFISSWECWWYAGSFGQRSIVQAYGILALPLAFFIERIQTKTILKWSVATAFVFFTLLNQFQVWQLVNGILHAELMTKEYYWKTFGKTSFDHVAFKYTEIDRTQLPSFDQVKDSYTAKQVLFLDYENPQLLRSKELICDTAGSSGTHSLIMDGEHIYGGVYKHPFDSLTSKDHLRIKMECDVFLPAESFEKEVSFVFNMVGNRGQNYSYTSVPFQKSGAQPAQWSHVENWFVTPHILHSDDILSLIIWNNGGGKVLVDNIKITLYEPIDLP